ncbi:MAG: hypothetical protein MUC88_19220 [Planctomycetes bacterium]|jgi:hypothetical protein|nr:hypothetical protein [Planctomycetota bacterium]
MATRRSTIMLVIESGLLSLFCLAGGALCAQAPATDAPAAGSPLPIRECYCPAHFGNSYEAMGPRELAAYLAELKWMGFNRYGDWMTTTDVCNPYTSAATWDLAKELLDRKKKAFRAAQELGLELDLIVTLNHVYLDQVNPRHAAKTGPRIQGQLICPSDPEARKIILGNFERWFEDLADAGIRLSTCTAFAYDYGGCACDQCRPWIVTFSRLMKEIHGLAQRRHPGVEPWFCSWWWTPEEHTQVNDWAAQEAPGWLKAMTMHIEYGQTRPKDVPVPAGCRKLAFVHIGYGDQRGREVYGRQGAVLAPQRLPQTLRELRRLGFEGFQAYSEGVFDDVNKTLLAGLASGRFTTPDAAWCAYAERYFEVPRERAADWAKWFARWGDGTRALLPTVTSEFPGLAQGVKPTWRLEQWRIRVELEELDRAIGTPPRTDWTADKLALAERWFATQERLYREVYRLGPVRHVLNPRFMPPLWYESWRQVSAGAPKGGTLGPQQ